MERKIILPLVALLCLQLVSGQVLITEVMYNPSGSEYDLEYVEIFNSAKTAVDIGGWYLNTTSSNADATIPEGTVLPANTHFLIADIGFALAKEPVWPDADYEEEITLSNSGGGVAITSPVMVEDSVGWGSVTELFESTPVGVGDEGLSLQRQNYVDSDNNSADFFYAAPNPEGTQTAGSQEIQIELTVEQESLEIVSVVVEDEDTEIEGVQVYPFPGQTKQKQVLVQLKNTNELENVTLEFNGSPYEANLSENETYSANVEIPYHLQAGEYSVLATACSISECTAMSTSINVEEVLGFELDSTKLTLGTKVGQQYELVGDLDPATQEKPTVTNTGNAQLNFMVTTTGLRLNESEIPPGNIGVMISGSAPTSYFELSTSYITEQPVPVEGASMLSLRFDVPAEVAPGTYNGQISLTAVK